MRCVGSKKLKTCTSVLRTTGTCETKLLADGAASVKLPPKPKLSLPHPGHPLHAAAKNAAHEARYHPEAEQLYRDSSTIGGSISHRRRASRCCYLCARASGRSGRAHRRPEYQVCRQNGRVAGKGSQA
ncbi:TPA: hypothetical protein N0F65_003420 [Lagenidium giganteum]|uniref:Uncharacterized protein n=1 Tax=Lagenidium giganteum TaxID=4803 RepID=A0AAV2YK39_9STRA|nr:TPA: hypothetical protein N0F65_003420 [Lagenidium giganteum]